MKLCDSKCLLYGTSVQNTCLECVTDSSKAQQGTRIRAWSEKEKTVIREKFKYDPETGKFFYTKNGKPAGSLRHGYVMLYGDNIQVRAHHVAWLLTYGEQYLGSLDHINRDRADNRICNLRKVIPRENVLNTNKFAGNLPGSRKRKGSNLYYASVYIDKKQIFLGNFKTDVEAHKAYLKKLYECGKELPSSPYKNEVINELDSIKKEMSNE